MKFSIKNKTHIIIYWRVGALFPNYIKSKATCIKTKVSDINFRTGTF